MGVLNFEHRLRLTTCVKELLALPRMSHMDRESVGEKEAGGETLACTLRRASGCLHQLAVHEQALLVAVQAERLKVSREEDDPDLEDSVISVTSCPERLSQAACFTGGVFDSPSAYILT